MLRGTVPVAIALLLSMCPVSQGQQTSRKEISLSVGLPEAAHETYVNYNRAYQAGKVTAQREGNETQIPSNYWTDPIKALNPLKVYLHRMNIVVVLLVHGNIEEGKYIYLPISSYLPMNGDDGFQYSPDLWHGSVYQLHAVLDYIRVRGR